MDPIIIKRKQVFRPDQKCFEMQTCELKKYTNHEFKFGDKAIVNDNVYYCWGINKKNIYFYDEKTFFDRKLARRNRGREIRAANLEYNYYVNYINNYKLSKGCENLDCKCAGFDNPCQLTFDHIKPEDKTYAIGNIASRITNSKTKKSQEKWLKIFSLELSKCRVLCWNCHMLKTKREGCGRKKIIKTTTKDKSYYIDRPPIIYLSIQK